MSRPEDGDFLGRWSARKLRARAERLPEPPPEPSPPAAEPVDPVSEKTDAEILDELGLPDPDSLVKGDDFKAFLRAPVPARLRNRALRRLWVSDPVLANLDGLNDYEQDFTDAATVMPGLKTAYRVGRGLLRDEPAEPPPAALTDEPQPDTDAPSGAMTPEVATDTAGDAPGREEGSGAGEEAAGDDDGKAAERPDEASEIALRPSRMRFRFEG